MIDKTCVLSVVEGKLNCETHGNGTHPIGTWKNHQHADQQIGVLQIPMRHVLYVAYMCGCGADEVLIDEEQ